MVYVHQLKFPAVEAIQLREGTWDYVANRCNGNTKGNKLPQEDRIIQYYDQAHQQEVDIFYGDWLVIFNPDSDQEVFKVFKPEEFSPVFKQLEPIE